MDLLEYENIRPKPSKKRRNTKVFVIDKKIVKLIP